MSVEARVTMTDIRNVLAGEGGVDLRVVPARTGAPPAMRVVGVTAGTTAERLGARDDDTIETINGQPLRSIPAAYAAVEAAVRSGRVEIRGTRDGAPYLTVLVIGAG